MYFSRALPVFNFRSFWCRRLTSFSGTGKSVLLRHIIKNLKSKYVRSADAVAITASTGIAACNIGGTTVHSFGGIGLGQEAAPQLAAKIRRNQKAMSRWVRTKALIIDESEDSHTLELKHPNSFGIVSMLEGDLFDKLEHVARILRKSQKPFGGIQVSFICVYLCQAVLCFRSF